MERAVLAHGRAALDHAVPLAATLKLRGLHGNKSGRRSAIVVKHKHKVLLRIFDVGAVPADNIFAVVVFAAFGSGAFLVRRIDIHRSTCPCSARRPLNKPSLIGAGDDANARLALVDVACDGVVDVALSKFFVIVEQRVEARDNLKERQGQIILADIFVTGTRVLFEHGWVKLHDRAGLFFLRNCFGRHIIYLS